MANLFEEGEFLPIPMNDVTVQIAEGIAKLRNAKISLSSLRFDELTAYTDNDNKVSIILNENLSVKEVNELTELIRPSQIQLFIYILYIWRKERRNELVINVKEYFAVRGIKRRKENVDRLYQDLNILSAITIDIQGQNKKKTYRAYGNLLTAERGPSIKINLGSWIEDLSPTTFTLLNKSFFKYHAKQKLYNVLLSIKLAQLIKVKSKNSSKHFRLRIATLLRFLDISNENIKKQGFGYYVRLLTAVMNELCTQEGYCINFDSPIYSYLDFMNAIFIFQHPILQQHYQEKLIRTS